MLMLQQPERLRTRSQDWGRFQGSWQLVSMHIGTRRIPTQIVGNSRLVIGLCTWEQQFRDRKTEYLYQIDHERHFLDLLLPSGDDWEIFPCMYRCRQDRLILCRPLQQAWQRPKEIVVAEGIGLFVWERDDSYNSWMTG